MDAQQTIPQIRATLATMLAEMNRHGQAEHGTDLRTMVDSIDYNLDASERAFRDGVSTEGGYDIERMLSLSVTERMRTRCMAMYVLGRLNEHCDRETRKARRGSAEAVKETRALFTEWREIARELAGLVSRA